MIDRQEFNETFQYFDKEIIVEIIDIFLSEYDERFKNLRANVAERDFEKLKFNAHSLKGVIANFKDPVTIDQSKRLDDMAKNKVENGLDKALADLEKSSAALIEELIVIKKKYS